MKKHYVIYVLLFILSMPCLSKAGEEQEEKVKMEAVVVTSGRIEEKKEDVTTNITVLGEEEIEKSSVTDLVDLLEEQGFFIREYPNSLASVSIRGFRTNTQGNDLDGYVLLLINGRRAGTGNLADIPLDNIEKVEIVRGPGATQYGASAVGGVVNIITKQGKGDFSAYAETRIGSWNNKKNSVGASGKFNNFDFSLSGSIESQDDYDTANGQNYYNTGFDSKERISIDTGYTFLETHRIGITFSSYDGNEIGSPSYLSQNDLDAYVDSSNRNYDLTYTGSTADSKLSWSFLYFRTDRKYSNFDDSATMSYYQDTDQQGVQAQFSSDWDFIRLTGGVDWVHYDITDIYSTGENTYDNPAAFLLAKSKLLDGKLIFSAGLRFDKFDIESDEGQTKSDENLSPSIGAVYKFNKNLSIRANYAEAFKMPTPDQLFMFTDYSAFGFGIWSGNEDLTPEKSKTYEVGMDYTKGTLSSSLTYFSTDFKDQIGYEYNAEEDITQYKNISGAELSGIEWAFNVDIGDIFDWSWELKPYTSLTYFIKNKNEESNTDLSYNPEWSTSYGIRLSNPDVGFVSSLNFSYFSKQNITDYEGTGATTLPGYTVANLSISKEIISYSSFGRLLLNGNISNLFNEDYAAIQGYIAPGRTFNLGLRYEY